MKKILCLVLIICLVIASLVPAQSASPKVAEGGFGNGATWFIKGETDLTLTVMANRSDGVIPDFSSSAPAPWNDYRDRITLIMLNGITAIGDYAFYGFGKITGIASGSGNKIVSIGDYAFASCGSVAKVNIQKSVKNIGTGAFANCGAVSSFTVEDGNTEYASRDGVLFTKDFGTVLAYPAASTETEYAVPDGVTEIGQFCFADAGSLKKVGIPDGTSKIGIYAFSGSRVYAIEIPSSTGFIGFSAFNPGTLRKGRKGDYSESYASENGLEFADISAGNCEHNYIAVSVAEPTCTAKGYTVFECEFCGAEIKGRETAKLGHEYESKVLPPTEKKNGYTIHTCIRCGKSYTDSITEYTTIPAATDVCDHDYKVTEIIDPTCTKQGYSVLVCEKCGDKQKGNKTAKLGHEYESEVVAPTEEKNGYTIHTCIRCGKSYTDSVTEYTTIPEATEVCKHDYKVTETVEPTCAKQGYSILVCEKCGDKQKGNKTEKLGHEYESKVIAPTEKKNGYTIHTCIRCGKSYTDSVTEYTTVPAATEICQHDYKVTEIIEPTCAKQGYSVLVCEKCGDTQKGNKTEKLGHEYESKVVAPTEEKNGYTIHTCIRCGKSYTDSITEYTTIPAATEICKHDYKVTEIIEPTCTKQGYSVLVCEKCGDTVRGNKAARTGHSYKSRVIPAEPGKNGYTLYTCVRCGKTKTDNITENTSSQEETPTATERSLRTTRASFCGSPPTLKIPRIMT